MSWLQNSVILPFFEPERHRGLSKRLAQLARFDRLPQAEQRALQSTRLSKILLHAYSTVPFYTEAFDAVGAHPADWKPGLPLPIALTNRETIRTRGSEMLSNLFRADQLQSASTGGTTSTPVTLFRDIEGLRDKVALQYHLNRWGGFEEGDKIMLLWGAERDFELNPSWRWKFYEQTIRRQIPAPAGQISDAILEQFFQRMNERKPKVLFGYAATVGRFAEYVLAKKQPHHSPKSVIVTAEPLTIADRQFITQAFGCPVTEQYGSREVSMIASDCEMQQGLHFHPAGCFTEFEFQGMTDDGPMYRLIVTDLLNYGMPLLRYDTGDCVLLAEGDCPCGRWFPRVQAVLGRAVDTLLLPDGTEIPGLAVANHVLSLAHSFRHVTNMQVIQKTLDTIKIRYVAIGTDAEAQPELAQIQGALNKVFRIPLHFQMERVPEILRAASGKMRFCISEVVRESLSAAQPLTN